MQVPGKSRPWAIGLLIAIFVALSLLFSRQATQVTVGRPPVAAPAGSPVPKSAEKDPMPQPPGPDPRQPAAERVLISWRRVPAAAAFFPVPLALPRSQNRLLFPKTWASLAIQTRSDQGFGADAGKTDEMLRGIGFVEAIDCTILKEAGFGFDRMLSEPRNYFPLTMYGAASTKDPASVIVDRLLSLWEKRDAIASSIPEQFQSTDVSEAIASRCLMLAGSYADDPRIVDLLSREFQSTDQPRIRLAAATALLQSGRDNLVLNWLQGSVDPSVVKDTVAALGGTSALGGFVISSGDFSTKYTAPASTVGRSLDSWVLNIAQTTTDPETRELAIRALAGRADRPDIREFLLNGLEDSSPASVAAAIFRENAPLQGSPRYAERLQHWLGSQDEHASLWALTALQYTPLPNALEVIQPLSTSTDARFVQASLFALLPHASENPERSESILSAVETAWPRDKMIETLSKAIRDQLDRFEADPAFMKRDLENALKRGWQAVPR